MSTPSSNEERVRILIAQQAADWFVANRGGLPPKERDAFAIWLTASPVHVEEFLALSVIARNLPEACASEDSIEAIVARARSEEGARVLPLWPRMLAALRDIISSRWQTAALAMAAFGVVCVGLLLLWMIRPTAQVTTPGGATALHFETRHGEQQTHRLADNSILHLNTDTAVTIQYSNTERQITITSGQAGFEVAHESKRAFRVLAGATEVVDLGTTFDVRLTNDSTVITVVTGRVAVGPSAMLGKPGASSSQNPRFIELAAGQQLSVSEGEWPATPVTVDAQRTTAWLRRQIMFEHEPLGRVAIEFNRYSRKPIEIITPALRDLEITGVFSTNDSEAFVAFLRSLEGVRVEVTATQIRVSQE
jgi:transmembrane sensor